MDFYDVFHEGSIVFTRKLREVHWDVDEIIALVLLSFGAQVILTFFGNRRKYRLRSLSRFCVWLSYLMASPVVTLALGKLSAMSIEAYDVLDNYQLTENDVYCEYKFYIGWWAPLLLMQICSPNIIAYSVEDSKLKLRQAFGLISQVAIALWINYVSWSKEISTWFIVEVPLSIAGIMKAGDTLRALWSLSNCENAVKTSFANSDIRKVEIPLEPISCSELFNRSKYFDLALLLKAYQRFDRLNPYLDNWIGHPSSIYLPSMSIDGYLPKDVFRIIEYELSFMYNVLYTKALTNYSKRSVWGRIICLLIPPFVWYMLLDSSSIITFVLLAGAIVLDLYVIMELLFSDWAILHLMKQNRGAFTRRLLIIVARKILSKKHRWSHCMDQFNLLSYCLYEEPTKLGRLIRRILKIKGYYKEYKKYCVKKDIPVPEELKKLLLQQIEEVRAQRLAIFLPNGGMGA